MESTFLSMKHSDILKARDDAVVLGVVKYTSKKYFTSKNLCRHRVVFMKTIAVAATTQR